MKIIAGKFKGRNIPSSKDASYRPSTSKFRESVFSILSSGKFKNFDMSLVKILDLFCGTGSLGLEALSRGADYACFIDIEGAHLQSIRSFAKQVNIEDSISYMSIDASRLCKAEMVFDLILMDPPYGKNLIGKTLESLLKYEWLNKSSYIIIECMKSDDFNVPQSYQIIDERRYGKTKLVILHYEQV